MFNLILSGQTSAIASSSYTTTDASTTTMHNMPICDRYIIMDHILFECPTTIPIADFEVDDLNSTILQSIHHLSVFGMNRTRGPLRTIPSNICRFTNLTVDISKKISFSSFDTIILYYYS